MPYVCLGGKLFQELTFIQNSKQQNLKIETPKPSQFSSHSDISKYYNKLERLYKEITLKKEKNALEICFFKNITFHIQNNQ